SEGVSAEAAPVRSLDEPAGCQAKQQAQHRVDEPPAQSMNLPDAAGQHAELVQSPFCTPPAKKGLGYGHIHENFSDARQSEPRPKASEPQRPVLIGGQLRVAAEPLDGGAAEAYRGMCEWTASSNVLR